MDLLTIILIAIGFAMQAFAFSTANGIIANSKDEGLLALTPVFGGFQMLTPEIGELVGLSYKKE
jgi:putative Mn2+ efflux pump MntP